MEITPKLDENGKIILDDSGNPIYIFKDKDGTKEEGVDVASLFSKITGLNKESAERRHKLNDLTKTLKVLEDNEINLEDLPEFVKSSKENIEKISLFEDKDMKSMEEIEKIKKGVSDSYEGKLKELNNLLDGLKQSTGDELIKKEQVIRNLLIKGAFSRSEFIKEKTVLTPDIAFNTFGRSFEVEEVNDGDPLVFAKDNSGEKIFSKTKPGEYADPEEAIEILIKNYHQSDAIMKPSQGGDTGKPFIKTPGDKGKIDLERLSNMSSTEKLKYAHNMKK